MLAPVLTGKSQADVAQTPTSHTMRPTAKRMSIGSSGCSECEGCGICAQSLMKEVGRPDSSSADRTQPHPVSDTMLANHRRPQASVFSSMHLLALRLQRVHIMRRSCFLIVTALGEAGTGLLLLVAPSAVIELLLGIRSVAAETLLLGRFAGGALLAIGIACWLARNDDGRAAQLGIIAGVLLYDVAAAGLLTYAALGLDMSGVALWPAVALHAVLAIWSLTCLRPRLSSEEILARD